MENRNLTDDDVSQIVTRLKAELVKDFYGELGRGVWAYIKRGLFIIMLAVILYGIIHDKASLHSIAQELTK